MSLTKYVKAKKCHYFNWLDILFLRNCVGHCFVIQVPIGNMMMTIIKNPKFNFSIATLFIQLLNYERQL